MRAGFFLSGGGTTDIFMYVYIYNVRETVDEEGGPCKSTVESSTFIAQHVLQQLAGSIYCTYHESQPVGRA